MVYCIGFGKLAAYAYSGICVGFFVITPKWCVKELLASGYIDPRLMPSVHHGALATPQRYELTTA
jgi:hypothetical protein